MQECTLPRAGCRVVRGARALVVLLVDLLDASGSLLGRVRDLVGNNPIVLVGEHRAISVCVVAGKAAGVVGQCVITCTYVHLVRRDAATAPCSPFYRAWLNAEGCCPACAAGTKADLLPEGTRERDVAEWLQAAAAFKKINAVSVHLVRAPRGPSARFLSVLEGWAAVQNSVRWL